MDLKNRLLSITAAGGLAALAFGLGPVTQAFAGTPQSTACSDGVGNDDVPILTNPITLGLEIGSPALAAEGHGGWTGGTYFTLCYATSPTTNTGPETAGGTVGGGLSAASTPYVACIPDSDAYSTSTGGVAPSCAISTSGTSGTTILFSIPFGVCAGSCNTNPFPNNTGAIIGALQQQGCSTAGCTSVVYTLQNLCIEFDGVPLPGTTCTAVNVGGVQTTGSSPVNYSTAPPNSPCTLGICVPVDYVGLSGTQLASIFVPGTSTSIPVFGVHDCLYYNTPSPPTGC